MHRKVKRRNRGLLLYAAVLLLACTLLPELTRNAYAASVNLAWDASPDLYVSGYNVYRSTQSGSGTSTPVNGTTLVTGTTYTDATVQSGTYYYVVRAVGIGGQESTNSNQVQVGLPSQITTSAATGNAYAASVNLAWDASPDLYLAGYNVYRSTQSGSGTSTPVNGTTLVTGTTYTDATVQNGTYYYVVRAVSIGGNESTNSNQVQVSLAPQSTNSAPTVSAGADQTITMPNTATLTAVAADDGLPYGSMTFRWSVVSGTGATLSNPNASSTQVSFAASGAYTFRITVTDGALSSTDDVIVSVTTAPIVSAAPQPQPQPQPLTAPTGLASQCSLDGKKFTVSWNPVAGATSYYLRVDYLANNASGLWYFADGTDYNIDAYTQTSFSATDIVGQNYSWWVHAANTTSGIGPSSGGTFTCTNNAVDTTAPNVSITAPAYGTVIFSNAVAISAVAADNIGVAGVQFMINNANYGAEITSAPYSISWNTKKEAAGVYVLQAVARDAAGNRTTSAPVLVKVTKQITGVSKKLKIVDTSTGPSSDELEAVTIGYAHAQATAGADGAIISLKRDGDIVSESSIRASAPVRQGRVYVSENGSTKAGLAIANDADEAAVISLYFTDGTGIDFGHSTFTIEAKHNIAAFVDQAPFNLNVPTEGSLTFTSSIPVAVTGLRGFTNERGEFLMTTLPVSPVGTANDQRSIALPQFADGGGWSTQVVLVNPADAPLTGIVQFISSESSAGDPFPPKITVNGVVGSSFNYSIPPRTAVRLATDNSTADVHVGYVLVTATNAAPVPQGLSILSFSKNGVTVSEAGLEASLPSTALHTYVSTGPGLRSALAITNPSASPVRATLIITALDAAIPDRTTSVELPAGGHLSCFVDELFPEIASGFDGMLQILSSEPLAASGLRVRTNSRGDTVITANPIDGEKSSGINTADEIIPLVMEGGSYSTEFIGIQQ